MAVLHVGDLGLYDRGSPGRLPARERELIAKHEDPIEQGFAVFDGLFRLTPPLDATHADSRETIANGRADCYRATEPRHAVPVSGLACVLRERNS